jgi:hypothetical protein
MKFEQEPLICPKCGNEIPALTRHDRFTRKKIHGPLIGCMACAVAAGAPGERKFRARGKELEGLGQEILLGGAPSLVIK